MIQAIFSALYWIYFSICVIFLVLLTGLVRLFTFPFDPYSRYSNKCLWILANLMLRINPFWSIKMEGIDKYKGDKPTVFVANHQSFLDLPLAYLLPWKMKWVVKEELFKIPVLGWLVSLTGHLSVDRSKKTAIKKLRNLVKPLKDNVPVMIFPEGTRSKEGKLIRFKSGAFMLAKRHGFQLQPMVLNGGHHALPRNSWKLRLKQQFHLSVLDPIDPDNFESIDELKNYTFDIIQMELERIQTLDRTKSEA